MARNNHNQILFLQLAANIQTKMLPLWLENQLFHQNTYNSIRYILSFNLHNFVLRYDIRKKSRERGRNSEQTYGDVARDREIWYSHRICWYLSASTHTTKQITKSRVLFVYLYFRHICIGYAARAICAIYGCIVGIATSDSHSSYAYKPKKATYVIS